MSIERWDAFRPMSGLRDAMNSLEEKKGTHWHIREHCQVTRSQEVTGKGGRVGGCFLRGRERIGRWHCFPLCR